jgi:Cdc6-like AAA superfamily ATPase
MQRESEAREARLKADKDAAVASAAARKEAAGLARREAATADGTLEPISRKISWNDAGTPTPGGSGAATHCSMTLANGAVVRLGDWVEIEAVAAAKKRGSGPSERRAVFIARILGMWRDANRVDRVGVAWAFSPEEMRGGRQAYHGKREIAVSVKADVVDAETIIRRARVKPQTGDDLVDSSSDESVARCAAPELPRARVAIYTTSTSYDESTCQTKALAPRELQCLPLPSAHVVAEVADEQALVSALVGLGVGLASGSGVHIGGSASIANKAVGEAVVDASALARSSLAPSAVPNSLPCREAEIASLTSQLTSALKAGGAGAAIYVSGMPGTGKTATVSSVVRSLEKAALLAQVPAFKYIEINAMRLVEPLALYTELWRLISGKSLPHSRACSALTAHFTSAKEQRPIVLVLDELDYCVTPSQSVLYNIFDWTTFKGAKLIVVGIANTMDMPERLLPKVQSRLGLARVTFQPYTGTQLETILRSRLLEGSANYDLAALQMASQKVAGLSGDLRRALALLHRASALAAARAAQGVGVGGAGGSNPGFVILDDVRNATLELSGDPVSCVIASLPPRHRLLLIALIIESRAQGVHPFPLDTLRSRAEVLVTQHAPASVLAQARGAAHANALAAGAGAGATADAFADAVAIACQPPPTDAAAGGATYGPTLAAYAQLSSSFAASNAEWEDAALALHEARVVSVSYPRATATGSGWGPIAAIPTIVLVAGIDTIYHALRSDPFLERMKQNGAF